MTSRLLEGKHRRAQLVAKASEEVSALLVRELLTELSRASSQPKARMVGPTHQPAA
jgi:hypothetical protein